MFAIVDLASCGWSNVFFTLANHLHHFAISREEDSWNFVSLINEHREKKVRKMRQKFNCLWCLVVKVRRKIFLSFSLLLNLLVKGKRKERKGMNNDNYWYLRTIRYLLFTTLIRKQECLFQMIIFFKKKKLLFKYLSEVCGWIYYSNKICPPILYCYDLWKILALILY